MVDSTMAPFYRMANCKHEVLRRALNDTCSQEPEREFGNSPPAVCVLTRRVMQTFQASC